MGLINNHTPTLGQFTTLTINKAVNVSLTFQGIDYLSNQLIYDIDMYTIRYHNDHQQADKLIPITPRKFKASSNSKCPCNSGKKFKLCCKVK